MVGKAHSDCYNFAPRMAWFKGWRRTMTAGRGEGRGKGTQAGGWRRLALSAGPLAVLLLVSGCSGSETSTRGESWLRDRFLLGISDKDREQIAAEASARAANTAQEIDYESLPCPPAEIRTSATHYTIYARNEIPDARSIRYQGTLNRVSRECDFRPDGFTMKFGFAGRVLVGPRGGEDSLTLPVKVDLATTGDRVVWSRVYRIDASIAAGQTSVPFVHVADDIAYQPKPGEFLQNFRLYVGFDSAEGR